MFNKNKIYFLKKQFIEVKELYRAITELQKRKENLKKTEVEIISRDNKMKDTQY